MPVENIAKLTLVSIYYRGTRHSSFIGLPVIDGKVVLAGSQLERMLVKIGVRHGDTYSIGY